MKYGVVNYWDVESAIDIFDVILLLTRALKKENGAQEKSYFSSSLCHAFEIELLKQGKGRMELIENQG